MDDGKLSEHKIVQDIKAIVRQRVFDAGQAAAAEGAYGDDLDRYPPRAEVGWTVERTSAFVGGDREGPVRPSPGHRRRGTQARGRTAAVPCSALSTARTVDASHDGHHHRAAGPFMIETMASGYDTATRRTLPRVGEHGAQGQGGA